MRRSIFAILTCLVAVTTFISPFQRELFVGDETKYGQIIREIDHGGIRLVPTLEGRPYSHKPPLHFWMIYGLTRLFGMRSIWPFVLPSLLSYLALILFVGYAARELFGDEAVTPSMFVFSSSWLGWGLSQTGRMDLSFTLLTSVGVFAIGRFMRGRGAGWLTLAAALVGGAILIKGPMSLVIAILVLALEAFRRRGMPKANYWLPLLVVASIPLAWVIPAAYSGGNAYAEELLVKQNVGRAFGSWVHREPFWFYVARSPVTLFPWFFTVLFSAIAFFKRRGEAMERADEFRFCLNWFLAALIAFSILSSKLDVYMVLAIPSVSLIAGWLIAGPRDVWTRRATIVNAIVIGVLGLVFLAGGVAFPRLIAREPDASFAALPEVRALFWVAAAAAMIGAIAIVLARGDKFPISVISLGGVALSPLIYLTILLMPVANQAGGARPLIASLGAAARPGDTIALYSSPHLWSRDMPDFLENVRYIGARGLEDSATLPRFVATRSDRASELGANLNRYEKIDGFLMRGKRFEVYRLRSGDRRSREPN